MTLEHAHVWKPEKLKVLLRRWVIRKGKRRAVRGEPRRHRKGSYAGISHGQDFPAHPRVLPPPGTRIRKGHRDV